MRRPLLPPHYRPTRSETTSPLDLPAAPGSIAVHDVLSFDSAGRIAITKGMLVDVGMLWSAAGVVGGFQVAAFTLRIHREIEVGSEDDLTWLPVADCLNLLSL